MKNEDIHSDLPKKEIRDFLGQLSCKESRHGYAHEIEYIENEIKRLEEI